MVVALREVVSRYSDTDFETYMAGGYIVDMALTLALRTNGYVPNLLT